MLMKQTGRLIKHVSPSKVRGEIEFGFDDPYLTGKVLSYASLFVPAYGDDLTVIPHFDVRTLDGEVRIKGRIRIGTIALIALRVWFDRDFKRVYRMFKEKPEDENDRAEEQ